MTKPEDAPPPVVSPPFRRIVGVALVWLLFLVAGATTTALAVQPDEILKDPKLEARARAISAGLRCLVCQNQSIDDSEAPVARDLRILIREQLQQNKSNGEIVDFVVARYGDFVLLKPRFTVRTAVLWLTPFAILFGGAIILFMRRRMVQRPEETLTAAEKAELAELLRK